MGTELSASDLKRINDGYKFKDDAFYLQWRRYMDMIVQVHSIVLTQKDSYVLRCWRGSKFGPPNKALEVESRLFRVKKEYFKKYVVPPEPRIANAVEKMGKECLLEIVVYDEHVASLDGIQSGDFLALQNVHGFVSGNLTHTLTIHGGMGYNRGITKIPVDFDQQKFIDFKAKVNSVLDDSDSKNEKLEAGKNDGIKTDSSVIAGKRAASEESSTVKPKNIRFDHIGFFEDGSIKYVPRPSNQGSPRFLWKTQAEEEQDRISNGESSGKSHEKLVY